MKNLCFFLLAIVSTASRAQTVDEVIQKYSAAMGGLEAFQKVQTVKMTGSVNTQDVDLPVTVQIINGRAMRTEVDAMGQKVINVYKDGKGWKINPFAGAETATDVEGNELNDFKSQANLANNLMDYKNLGHKVELEGQEKVEGVDAYKIKLTNKDDGRVTISFLSVKDNGLIKTVTSRDVNGQLTDIETVFSDLKEFAGLKFYMTRTQSVSGQVFQTISFTNIELNVLVDEKIFNKG